MLRVGGLYQVDKLIDGNGHLVNDHDRWGNTGFNMRGRYEGYKLLDFVVILRKHSDYVNMYECLVMNDRGVRHCMIDGRELREITKSLFESCDILLKYVSGMGCIDQLTKYLSRYDVCDASYVTNEESPIVQIHLNNCTYYYNRRYNKFVKSPTMDFIIEEIPF